MSHGALLQKLHNSESSIAKSMTPYLNTNNSQMKIYKFFLLANECVHMGFQCNMHVCPSAETVHGMADICGYRINLGIQYKEQYNRDS